MASIQKRGSSYRVTVSCGYDIRGKKLLQTATFTPEPNLSPKKLEKAVQAFAFEFEQRVKNGQVLAGEKTTLQEFAQRWLTEYAQVHLEAGTLEKYRYELEVKILPALGHRKLSEIKPHHLNAFYLSLTRDGARQDGKKGGYRPASIHKTHVVLSSMLRTAVEWEILDRNPCSAVKLPAVQDTAEQIKFFTPEQTHAFLAFLHQEHTWQVAGHQRIDDTGKPYRVGPYVCGRETPLQIQVLLELAIYTGMRKGEILALTWADINFEQDTVSITKSASPVKGKILIKAPKTKSSRRVVTIPHSLTERLDQLRQAQAAYRAQVGEYWQETEEWIFTQENGRMMHYTTPYHTLQTLIGQYNQCHPDAPLPHDPLPRPAAHLRPRCSSAPIRMSKPFPPGWVMPKPPPPWTFIPMPCGKMTAKRRIPWSRCWDEKPDPIWRAPKVCVPINNRPSQNCHTDRRGTILRWYLFCLLIPIDRTVPANPAVPDAPGTILPHRNTPESLSGL